jgi:hypothetical protein
MIAVDIHPHIHKSKSTGGIGEDSRKSKVAHRDTLIVSLVIAIGLVCVW